MSHGPGPFNHQLCSDLYDPLSLCIGNISSFIFPCVVIPRQVGALTTGHQTHCQCNHLSYFTSNFLVKPNKVDFFADAKLFLTFVDNPLVVSTVAAILGMYVGVAIWARRKDKQDEQKVRYHLSYNIDAITPLFMYL